MNILKKISKYCLYLIVSILLFVFSSVLLSYITVNKKQPINTDEKVYLSTNGVHLSVIVPINNLSKEIKKDLKIPKNRKYARFGWGSEDFYLNIPTWSDFKIKYALGALFLDKPTLIEISYHRNQQSKWIRIPISKEQLQELNIYISSSFKLDEGLNKRFIAQDMYPNSYFYKANGSYSPIKTCNTWVNNGFKQSDIKASYWTLFDFGLLNKYKE